ncbi:MAG: hypothetical protein L0Y55_09085 [Anaerolineales bacterium]|nr:hypothetical protein [Anaerolineales bacterium]
MDGSRLPKVTQDKNALDLAARYAPIILADEREPFTIVAVGYTVFEREDASPSFPKRRVSVGAGSPHPYNSATRAIEYALWWDWDIGHLYELEHAWTFIGVDGAVAAVEASWHGMFGIAEIDGKPPLEGTHPLLLAQPGKHAMAASSEPFDEIREWAEQEAGRDAGKDGVLDNGLFRGKFFKTPENDARVTAYLKQRAFTPLWNFNKRLPVTREMLVPWDALAEWIPARVAWWLARI